MLSTVPLLKSIELPPVEDTKSFYHTQPVQKAPPQYYHESTSPYSTNHNDHASYSTNPNDSNAYTNNHNDNNAVYATNQNYFSNTAKPFIPQSSPLEQFKWSGVEPLLEDLVGDGLREFCEDSMGSRYIQVCCCSLGIFFSLFSLP